MLAVTLAFVALCSRLSAPPTGPDRIALPHELITINALNAPIGEVTMQAFEKLHLKLKIAPRAHAVAESVRISVGMYNVPFDAVIHRILVPYLYLAPSLIVRKDSVAYILDLPTVSLWITNAQPGMALHEIFDQVGCDYCIDLESLGVHAVTVSIDNQPLDIAFRIISGACKAPAPLSLEFVDGCILVRPTIGSMSIEANPSPRVMARFLAHNRREGIAALLDCFHQSYVISGPVAGAVTFVNGMLKATDLLRKAFDVGSEQYTYASMDNVYMIIPVPGLGDGGKE